MDVDAIYIVGISKDSADKEVKQAVTDLVSRYRKKLPAVNVVERNLSLDQMELIAGSNKKAKKAKEKVVSDLHGTVPVPAPPRVGLYLVFHGGGGNPIDLKGLARLVLTLCSEFLPNGNVVKVVLSACYFASTWKSQFDQNALKTFCTNMKLESSNYGVKELPMLASWNVDVYIDNSKGGHLGHTQTKVDGKYVKINDELRNKHKIIAIAGVDGYVLKEYSEGAENWHDGVVKSADGRAIHVKS